jgi:hypothetical protein
MSSSEPVVPGFESDARFPSGPWTGFFIQPHMPGKHWMELKLTFRDGIMEGEGRDRVGPFLIKGRYQVEDGKCFWNKTYVKRHSLMYQGYNEGKGIWGTWEENARNKGGFHIWPEGMADPTQIHLAEEADAPVSEVIVFEPEETAEPVGAPAEVAEPAISSFEMA